MAEYNFDKYMEDCIHLRACRRISKILRNDGKTFSRNCTETCTAYVSGDDEQYVTVRDAVEFARDGAPSILSGYSEYNVYCTSDLNGKTLRELCGGN